MSRSGSVIETVAIVIAVMLYTAVPVAITHAFLGFPVTGVDDADIFLTYARNILRSGQIVYSVGGERVEGFSSPLYLALCTICTFFFESPERALLFLNSCLVGSSLALLLYACKKVLQSFSLTIFNRACFYFCFLFWIFNHPSYFAWMTVSLMDSGLYGSILNVACAFFLLQISIPKLSYIRVVNCLIVLSTISSRPEGFLWCFVFLFLLAILTLVRTKNLKSLKLLWPEVTFTACALLAFFLTRYWYFGYFLPNTYYAKVSISFATAIDQGWSYFVAFTKMHSPLIFLPLLVGIILTIIECSLYFRGAVTDTKKIQVACILHIFCLFSLILPIVEGGDHFNGFRFFQPALPFLILPLLILMTYHHKPITRNYLTFLAFLSVAMFSYFNVANWTNFKDNNISIGYRDVRHRFVNEFQIAAAGRATASKLNLFFEPHLPTIATAAAGGIALKYNGTVVDAMGLNDTRFAHAQKIKTGPKGHQSFDRDVFLVAAPDILLPSFSLKSKSVSLDAIKRYYVDTKSWDNQIFKNLFNDIKFLSQYTLASVENHTAYQCYGFFNNTYIEKLKAQNNWRVTTLH